MTNRYVHLPACLTCRIARSLVVFALLLAWAGPARSQVPAWQLALSGNDNQPRSGRSSAQATATDGAGNVYIVGAIFGEVTFGNIRLVGTGNQDMFVAKWNTATNSWAWAFAETTHAFGGNSTASSIAVNGNSLYVAGSFASGYNASFAGQVLAGAGNQDIFLAKYTDNGSGVSPGWATSAGGTSYDYGYGVATSGTSVYLTGLFVSATNVQIAGQPVTGAGDNDLFLAKYTDNGSSFGNSWVTTGGGTGADIGSAVVANGSNVYVTGYFASGKNAVIGGRALPGLGAADMFVAKYTDNGPNFSNGWVVDDGGTSDETGYALAVSGNNVYATGFSASYQFSFAGRTFTTVGSSDMFLAKYVDNGATFANGWATTGGGSGADAGYAVTTAGSTVYVAGTTQNFYGNSVIAGNTLPTGNGGSDMFAAQYTDSGTSFGNGWANSGGGDNTDIGYGVVVSGTSVYTAISTGSLGNTAAQFGTAPVLLAPVNAGMLGQLRASDGTWQRVEAPLQGTTSQVRAMATDASGNVFVAGSFIGRVGFGTTQLQSIDNIDMFVAKWNTATSTWAWATSGGGRYTDAAYGIAVSGGNVYVTGYFTGISGIGSAVIAGQVINSGGSQDVFLAKYVDNGNNFSNGWVATGGGTLDDVGNGVAVRGTSVYVVGTFVSSTSASIAGQALAGAGSTDAFLAKFTDNGTSVGNGWAASAGGPGADAGQAVAADAGNVYATGSFASGGNARIAGQILNGAGGTDVFLAKL